MAGRPSVYRQELEAAVEQAAGYGISREHIAEMLGISEDSLRRHYQAAWKRGLAMANFKIAKKIFEEIESGNTILSIFAAKVHLGWQEKVVEERKVELTSRVFCFDHTDSDEPPIFY